MSSLLCGGRLFRKITLFIVVKRMKLLNSLVGLALASKPRGEHYDWSDGIVILDTSNFYQIYDSSTSWAVLYYSKWCTHCNSFAPQFKDFALDVRDWSPWLRVAAIDCASASSVEGEDNGQDICFKQPYIITSMPDLRFYPAQTPRKGMLKLVLTVYLEKKTKFNFGKST